jgi:hypothetical protein
VLVTGTDYLPFQDNDKVNTHHWVEDSNCSSDVHSSADGLTMTQFTQPVLSAVRKVGTLCRGAFGGQALSWGGTQRSGLSETAGNPPLKSHNFLIEHVLGFCHGSVVL